MKEMGCEGLKMAIVLFDSTLRDGTAEFSDNAKRNQSVEY